MQLIVGLWVIRDIRFHVLQRFLTDAKKPLGAERLQQRRNMLRQFTTALTLASDPEATLLPGRSDLLWLPNEQLEHALRAVSDRLDRALVRDAVALGAHVFLTRDDRVLAAARDLRPWSLRICSPGDLLEDLVADGAFHCLLAPEYAYWPLPDQARVSALLRALPEPLPMAARGAERDYASTTASRS